MACIPCLKGPHSWTLLSHSNCFHPSIHGAFGSQALCMPVPLKSQRGTTIQQPMGQACSFKWQPKIWVAGTLEQKGVSTSVQTTNFYSLRGQAWPISCQKMRKERVLEGSEWIGNKKGIRVANMLTTKIFLSKIAWSFLRTKTLKIPV